MFSFSILFLFFVVMTCFQFFFFFLHLIKARIWFVVRLLSFFFFTVEDPCGEVDRHGRLGFWMSLTRMMLNSWDDLWFLFQGF